MTTGLKMILAAFILLIIGVILPFMIVLGLLESTLFLNFISFASSTAGLLLGFIGIARVRAGR